MKVRNWIACAGLGLGGAVGIFAQTSAPAWGVDSSSAEIISAWDMQTLSSVAEWGSELTGGMRYMTSGTMVSGVRVPQGAKITTMVVDGCDESNAGGLTVALLRSTAGATEILATADSGIPDMPGCSLFAADLASPETADYDQYRYWISGGNTTPDGLTRVGAVRILYQLQVSPPPPSATFNDVPSSDPGYQFVEALVQSGITAGCGSGNFCPDAPLTRRQMAVFLAKALGLQFQ